MITDLSKTPLSFFFLLPLCQALEACVLWFHCSQLPGRADIMDFRDLRSLSVSRCSTITIQTTATLKCMCHHKQISQSCKQSPAHCLLTCIIPYIGKISHPVRVKRLACQEFKKKKKLGKA